MKLLITSGGTKVPIDDVRDITNMSNGTFGSKIAHAALRFDHEVVFFKANGSKTPMSINADLNTGFSEEDFSKFYNNRRKYLNKYVEAWYKTFEQYRRGLHLLAAQHKPDVIVLAAAVSDYAPIQRHRGKFRSNDDLTIKLDQLPKIISLVKSWAPKSKVVGFKLLVGSTKPDLIEAAKLSISDNKCDMIVANDLDDIRRNQHKITLVFPNKNPMTYNSDPEDPDYLAKVIISHIEML